MDESRVSSNFLAELPVDLQINILLDLTPQELSKYCQTNAQINALCRSDEFLWHYALRKYGINLNDIPGKDLQEKLRRVQELIYMAETTHLKRIPWHVRDEITGEDEYVGMIFQPFSTLLITAVRYGSPQLLEMITQILMDRVEQSQPLERGSSRDFYWFDVNKSFRDAFIEALKLDRTDLVELILKYYKPQEDSSMYHYYNNAVCQGNLPLVKTLYTKYLSQLWDRYFWSAIRCKQRAVADYFLDELLQKGKNPLTHPEHPSDAYFSAIEHNDLEWVKLLSEYVLPNEQWITRAMRKGFPEIAEFLKKVLKG